MGAKRKSQPAVADAEIPYPHVLGSHEDFHDLFGRVLTAIDAYCIRTEDGGVEIPDANAAEALSDLYTLLQNRVFSEFALVLKKGGSQAGFRRSTLKAIAPLHDALRLIAKALSRPVREHDAFLAKDGPMGGPRFEVGDVISADAVHELMRANRILEAYRPVSTTPVPRKPKPHRPEDPRYPPAEWIAVVDAAEETGVPRATLHRLVAKLPENDWGETEPRRVKVVRRSVLPNVVEQWKRRKQT